ncbi:TPA: LysR family transcriptional regulator, partial [Salmonella enterica]
ASALVDAFSKHLQTHLSRLVEPLEVILGPMTKA